MREREGNKVYFREIGTSLAIYVFSLKSQSSSPRPSQRACGARQSVSAP